MYYGVIICNILIYNNIFDVNILMTEFPMYLRSINSNNNNNLIYYLYI